ncbi:MAG TPA: phosphomannose isomerase type II C-terminal cupin domain [Patescibacteria group bacterium]|jgi:mannose-6-phosphate isomerase-like protein (cupin superfamily)|nr:phosphomannose isomerase type II C-terminal cupin domain [Patescibacteria group bacterium]
MAENIANRHINPKVLINAKLFEKRPWGTFQVLFAQEVVVSPKMLSKQAIIIKQIIVNPGEMLSDQRHKRRGEQWQIMEGQAKIWLNGEVATYKTGNIIYIPVETWHRVANPSRTKKLVFLEITDGVFDEHDIERRDDKYDRKSDWINQ